MVSQDASGQPVSRRRGKQEEVKGKRYLAFDCQHLVGNKNFQKQPIRNKMLQLETD